MFFLESHSSNTPSKRTSKKATSPCSVVDQQNAQKLNNFLKEQGYLHKEASTSKSAEHFRLLREKDGYDDSLIGSILQYYLDHFGERWMLECYSTKAFREKFLAIVRHKEKNNPDISPEAKKVVELLTKNKHWPKGSDQELPNAVQISMNNIGKWFNKFKSLNFKLTEQLSTFPKQGSERLKLPDKERMEYHRINNAVNYMERMKQTFWWTPEKFVYYWFLEFHDGLGKWDEFNGSLQGQILTTTHRRFNGMFLDFTVQYCGNTKRWDELKEMIKGV